MPLDLRQIVQDREQELQNLIESQPAQAAQGLADITPGIESFRRESLGGLAGIQGVDPTALRAESLRTQGTLGNRLASLQDQTLAGVWRNTSSALLGARTMRADRLRGEESQAKNFARQNMFDVIRRRNESDDLGKQLEQAKLKEGIASEYSNRGLALEGQDNGDAQYQAALYRALFGLTGAIGTGLLMRGGADNGLNFNYRQPGLDSLRGQTGFSTTLNPLTGQRMPFGLNNFGQLPFNYGGQ